MALHSGLKDHLSRNEHKRDPDFPFVFPFPLFFPFQLQVFQDMRNGHIKNPCPLFVNMESLFFEKSICPDIAVPGTPKLQKIGQDESQVCIKPVAMT